jgi:hypothetical protein
MCNLVSHIKGKPWISRRQWTRCWEKYLNPTGKKWQEASGNFIMRSYINCDLHKIFYHKIKEEGHVAHNGSIKNV